MNSAPDGNGPDAANQTTYLATSEGGGQLLLPGGGFAFHADYAHEGADLVITGADGARVVIIDYFAAGAPADLMTLDGHLLPGDLVKSLAGPLAPGQYAQESQTADVPAAAPEIGTVQEVQGTVTATGADGLKIPLTAGSSVFQGDVLDTSSDGAVNIVFIDGTTFSLGGDAKMVLDELIYDAAADTGSSLMSVVTGTFVFITGQVAKTGPEAMQVRTPSGTIGIRGTKVGCNLEVADGQTICVLLPEADGEVGEFIFSNESGSQGVSNAYDAIIANAFTATLAVTQVLPSQAAALLQGLLPGVLQTEAPPVVLSQGGTFAEFVTNQGNASFGLQTSGVLDDQEMTPELTGGTVPEQDPLTLGVAASFFIAEPSADGPGTLTISQINTALASGFTLTGFSITANGSPFTLTSGGEEVVLVQDGNLVEGFIDGELILRFELNPDTGEIIFFLGQPLDHQDTDATGSGDTIEFTFDVFISFIDGTDTTILVQASVLDAGPTVTTVADSLDEAVDLGVPVVGSLSLAAGNDGLVSAELVGVTASAGGGTIALTSGGEAITLKLKPGSTDTYIGETESGTTVFEITFDPDTGEYTFTLLEPLDQPSGGTDSIVLTFNVAVTDGDGDSVISTIVLTVTDDVVVAVDDDGTVEEGAAVPLVGFVLDNDDSGVDGFGGITQFVHDGIIYFPDADGEITIETALGGSFTFNFNSGEYSYIAPDSVDNSSGDPTETFVYTVIDGDGDSSTATLTVAVGDVNEPTANPDSESLDEAAGDGAGFVDIVKAGSLTDDDDAGADGFGTPRITDVSYDDGLGTAVKTENATTITYTSASWTLTINKLTGDYTFTQTDSFDHDAVQGTNDAVGSFTYTLQDLDGSTDSSTLTITITDDVVVAVGDDGGSVAEGSAAPVEGNVLGNDDSGVDGFGGVLSFTHNGITYTPDADGIITITTNEGGSFTFDFNTGDYSYVAPDSVDNSSGNPVESFTYIALDGDGDQSDPATLTITVTDANAPGANPDSESIDEATGDGGSFGPIVKSGNLTDDDNPGDDGFGTPRITEVTYDDGLDAAVKTENATTITFTSASWILTIDKLTGDYTFTQTDAFDHDAIQGTNDAVGTFTYTMQDLDGSTSSSTLTITITDDVVVALGDDGGSVDEGAAASGNVLTNDDSGVDGFGMITQVVHDGVTYTEVGGVITITDTALGGTFTLDVLTGDYDYTAPDLDTISGDGTETFLYTVIDGDGDAAVALLTIQVDDRPQALDDQNQATEGGDAVTGNVITENDIIGDGPGRISQISFTTLDAAEAAYYAAMDGFTVTEEGGVYTITATIPEGDSKTFTTFTTLAGGMLTIDSDGGYEYVPPPEGDLRDDATETFTYTVVDSDGDTDSATLTITVDDVIEPAGAFLLTNTNAGEQDLRLIVTQNDVGVVGSGTPSTAEGQEGTVELGNGDGVLFEETESYAVIVKFESGSGTTNLTDLDLIFNLAPEDPDDLDDPDNVFLTLLDQGNIQLGEQGSGVDGAIWLIEFDPDPEVSDYVVSDAILYDLALDVAIADSDFIGDLVIFDSDTPHVSFDLDFGLLTTAHNVSDPDLSTFSTLDEFGEVIAVEIEAIDISGSHADEANTLTLSAQDVMDATDGSNQLIVLGDSNDTLVLEDEDGSNWELQSSGVTLDGSSETFDLYVADFGITLLADSDLMVQLEAGV